MKTAWLHADTTLTMAACIKAPSVDCIAERSTPLGAPGCSWSVSQHYPTTRPPAGVCRSLLQEEQELQSRQPPAPERLRKVRRWIEERSLALQVQEELVEAKQMQLISVEAGLRMAEAELDFLADEKQVCGRGRLCV